MSVGAALTPDGAVCACAVAPGSQSPTKAAKSAAVTIRPIASTKPVCARKVSDCGAEVNHIGTAKPVGMAGEPALNRRDVE